MPSLIQISRKLSDRVTQLSFSAPVSTIYNPLEYARKPHEAYLRRYGKAPKQVLLVGMNPGPFGMAQTGVPFGDVALVRDWLRIDETVSAPAHEHPKRPIQGFACPRSEVSGTRLWGWAKQHFGTPERFFERFFVANYCPLCFMEASGKNYTPDKLRSSERSALFEACDAALREVVRQLRPRLVVGVGAFAEKRAADALLDTGIRVATILHPSPASPRANRGWAAIAERQLLELGAL